MTFEEKQEQALWTAHSLFQRGKVSGSTANLSFRDGDTVYITAGGSCFGRLTAADLVPLAMDGTPLSSQKPSKEWPLHLALYRKPEIEAVLHTHSPFATLWSCLPDLDPDDALPGLTPYLKMRVGRVALVPFAQPGSQELFHLFRERLGDTDCYLLARHGAVAANQTMLQAFYDLEELEETARISWLYEQFDRKRRREAL